MDNLLLLIFTTISFGFGLIIGSFFNVVIDRLNRGEQFFSGRSYCESCKHSLSTLDLIPLFSYLLLNGKCRYCKSPIPASLAALELTTGIIFAALTYSFLSLDFLNSFSFYIFLLLLASLILLIFFMDLRYMVIADIFIYSLVGLYVAAFGLNFLGIIDWGYFSLVLFGDPLHRILAAAALFVFFAILHYAFKGKAMGEGDMYLAGIFGLYLGPNPSIVMWFIAFLTGAIAGVILIMSHRKKMKSMIPFGPFLVLGFAVSILFGNQIFNWYLNLL